MGYDLKPKNKNLEDFHFGAFSFPVLHEALGYLFPCIAKGPKYYAIKAHSDERQWHWLVSNDGFRVTADEARIMARMARNWVRIQRTLPKDQPEVDILQPEYLQPWPRLVRDDWHDLFERFADWADQSSGFEIW